MSRFSLTSIFAALLLIATITFVPAPWNLRIALAVALLYTLILGLGVAFIRLNFFQYILCQGRPDAMNVALTFDDGPDPESTGFVLDLLAAHEIHATFFCRGDRAQQFPDIARRIVEEGHTIGNHSMHHRWNTNFLFGKRLEREIDQAQQAIHDASGVTPKFFRPPMGLTNPHYQKILIKLEMSMIGWNVRSLDLNTDDPEIVLRRIVTQTRAGSIILLHDAGQSKEFLGTVLAGLIKHVNEKSLTFVTVDELQES